MEENNSKSTISNASSYLEISEFWDSHDADNVWDQTEAVEFKVDIRSEVSYQTVGSSPTYNIRKSGS